MNLPDPAKEAVFYNALNMAANSNYKLLRKKYHRCGSWEKSWQGSKFQNGIDPELEWLALHREGVGLLLAGEPDYPPLLTEIPNPPLGIYFKGSLNSLKARVVIAVVGTRKASAVGKILAKEFGLALARAGCTVVSGLAFGIDAGAHAGAIQAKGPTIAVLANGLDRIYPASNARLAAHIIEGGGALISEYPLGSPPFSSRFLERNRIVSGLSQAVVAIEVPERSGVLATARFAADQNRDLFVAPGPVTHPNFKGSHRLIRQGATLITSPQELLEDLGFQVVNDMQTNVAQTAQEEKILAAIRGAGRPLTIDEIIEAATLTSAMANQAMTMLVLRSAVREDNGRYFLK